MERGGYQFRHFLLKEIGDMRVTSKHRIPL